MRKIGWGVVAVGVLVAGAFAFTLLGGGPKSPEPGVCGHIERADEGAGALYRAIDCGAEHANVRVAKVVEEASQCPTGGSPYTIFTRSATLCLIPNFVQGACYEGDKTVGMRKVDCTSAEAVRVTSVAKGRGECANGHRVTYPEPAVTFCLVRVAELR
ncbi:LppU/SCO3897 family protein [Saccharothrix isguenensis]